MSNNFSAILRLISTQSSENIEYILSTKQPNLIGRSPECQVVLNPQEFVTVSRFHAQIELIFEENQYFWQVKDNGTINGTLINGEKITTSYILQEGDRIMLGLKGPEFIFHGEILNPTVLVEISGEELTVLEIANQKNNDDIDNDEVIEEIIENGEDILEENIDIDSKEKSIKIEENKVDILEEISEKTQSIVEKNDDFIQQENISDKKEFDDEKIDLISTAEVISNTHIIPEEGKTQIIDNVNSATEIISNTYIIPEEEKTQIIDNVNSATEIISNTYIIPEEEKTQIIDNVNYDKIELNNAKLPNNKSAKSNIINEKKVIENTPLVDHILMSKSIWNLVNFTQIKHIKTDIDKIQCLAISNDNKFIVTGGSDKLVKLWNVEKEKEIASFVGHKMAINAVSFSDDNKFIVTGGSDKLVKLWNVEEEKEIASFVGHKMAINAVSFSGDNKSIVTGGSDKLVKLWNVEEEKEIASFVGHKMAINAVSFSSDNKFIVSGGNDKLIKLWNVEKETEEKTIKTELKSPITALFFHPNNQSILCFSQQEQKISLIDLDNESELFSFRIPSQFPDLTVMNVDGSYFVSTNNNNNIIIWQI
jgi:pSer/pThr/pTyr-binding forkhead associated (FHA) protein